MTQTTAITPMDAFRRTVTAMSTEFSAALPAQIPTERFIRTALTAIQMNPGLLTADRRSLLGACMRAAQDGLLLDGREAALVTFGAKGGTPTVQYMPMIAGILKKLHQSGAIASLSAHVAHEHDQFEYELGDNERIVHRPQLDADRGKVIAVYAIARTKDGAIYREVMSFAEVERVRASSRSRGSGPWTDWWDEMARKTVIRRLAKRLPSASEVEGVFAADNDAVGLESAQAPPAQLVTDAPARGPSRLRRSIAATVTTPTAQPEEPGELVVVPVEESA